MVRMTRIEMGLEELGELWRIIAASPMLLAVGLCGSSRSTGGIDTKENIICASGTHGKSRHMEAIEASGCWFEANT